MLIVDDEPSLRRLATTMLEHLGFETVTCANAHEALRELEDNPHGFRLAVVDYMLPDMKGTLLAKELRILSPRLPLVLCSGQSDHVSDTNSFALGFQHYLKKPFTLVGMSAAISAALDEAAPPMTHTQTFTAVKG
ncbi:MAG: response regulator [Deltaproteobacteria bacterium]|nr:response regulator [Deltaproteobacteria bacterium]